MSNGKSLTIYNQTKKIKQLTEILNEFISDNCERSGDEDWPKAADEQSCGIVKRAMKLLDI